MALTSTIPKIYSARFLANLDMAMVYGRAINSDYQPDIVKGSAVEVNKFGGVTIGDYEVNVDFAAGPETLTTTPDTITADQQKFFNIQVDKIDLKQSANDLSIVNKPMERAGYGMATTIDAYIAGLWTEFSGAIGTDLSPVTPVASDIYGYLTQAAQILDEANVPNYARYAIMDAAGIKLLKDAGVFLSDTVNGDLVRYQGQFMDPGLLPQGYKGAVAGFDLYFSNQTPAGAEAATSIWSFGHNMGISMIRSLNEMELYSPEKRFASAVKGLMVYGAAVTQPDSCIAMFTA